ncbi:MAG: hypothetical protein E5W15_01740 [Mesorhizobium sp.]|uniref:hypothetical protein n=1 Tax=unclassified Mesorhizobium TaxID=325217 RepID=UPI000FCB17D3|nr:MULTISPECIES: hypothetical protein [unclassified Mesorhizobium]RUW41362.1 hypothetical protein EOA37_10475 [Mesorhizobium sp. M2A.F.Ca.ET.015.02.1.1]RVC97106.1 hypothetical protein EN739_05890 [Mesorhizobium sp. M2A.F.Ca.ET.017.03.2.1]RVD09117.1 hypothetical protein EN753_11460 [Mesorhizobium sp. M2A.F.Ca.ET.029.05.1.1]RWB37951.1 MAG: hypothetical protein EOQ46_30640 [Mesorhizobium sp.]RWB55287.1 MAG: hypothetical protein EOQ48_30265 [Mesorhizobium sp.]
MPLRSPRQFPDGEPHRLILKHDAEASTPNRDTATRIAQCKGRDASRIKPLMNQIKYGKGTATEGG